MKRRYRFHAVLLLLGLFLATRTHADPASRQEMRQVCRAWLDHRVAAQGGWSGSQVPEITAEQPILLGDDVLGYAFRIAPQGFILVPARKELCPVWFFSETGSLDFTTENEAADVLRGRLALTTEIATRKAATSDPSQEELVSAAGVKNRSRWAQMTEKSAEWVKKRTEPAEQVGPLMTTRWAQAAAYNLFCPLGQDSVRCPAGCTAIAAAQVARYHAYPPNGGTGEDQYQWRGDRCRPGSVGATLYADFRDPYDWNHMPDVCFLSCGSQADSAVAELCYELGVAGHVDYGTSCGTTAPLEALVDALKEHFGYDEFTESVFRNQVATAHDWFGLLQDEINDQRPVLYSFQWLTSAEGHALVCDGWSIDTSVDPAIEYVSLNLGFGGITGWFAVDDNGMSEPMTDNAILRLAPQRPAVVVTPNGDGDYPDIQSAIDAAHDGTVIELLDGVYRGNGNRDLNCLGKRIIIRSRSNDPALCIIDCEGMVGDQHRAFVFNRDETFTTVIQGITMRNGYVASETQTSPAEGGAVNCQPASVVCGSRPGECASPRLTNCVFAQNHSDRGGAIACSGPAVPLIETCVFSKNIALAGGGLSKTGTGVVQIQNSTFYRNSAAWGSGLYVGPQSGLAITRSIVARNQLGGGLFLADSSTARLNCCDLYANDAGDWTGRIANQLNRDGNMSVNPMFCDGERGDLGLDLASPCAESACGRLGARSTDCGRITYYVGAAPQYLYNTIEQALAVAVEGGRIVLVDSLYRGEGNRDLTIPQRGLTIESAATDPATCVMDVQGTSGEPHRAFELHGKHGVTFRGITIRHGWSESGGAIYLESADSTQILNCAFRECAAGGSGSNSGGAVCVHGEGVQGGRTALRDCSFDLCTADSSGGAVNLSYRELSDTTFVENCTFSANTAGSRGGALAGRKARVKVRNSVFRANSAPNGGAVMIEAESRAWFESCTLVGDATASKGACAYIYDTNSAGYFTNCILTSEPGRPSIECSSTPGTTVTVTCCNLGPTEEGPEIGCLSGRQSGNIHEDPQFCAPEAGDYRLRATSPCLPDQPGNQGCGPVGALPAGCGPQEIPQDDKADLSFRRCGPNPFHQEIRINYVIPARAATWPVDISIYDAGGRLVRTVFQGAGSPGERATTWNALDDNGLRVGSGVFFCRLRAGAEKATQRLIVLR
jgi:predicted outer membrane repeat protein